MQPFRHFTLLATLLITQSGQAEVPAGEPLALVDVYHSTQDEQWRSGNNDNWLVGDPCDWQW